MKKLGLALLLSTAVFSAWGVEEYNLENDQVESVTLDSDYQDTIMAVKTKGGKKVTLSQPFAYWTYLTLTKTTMKAYLETKERSKWREQQKKFDLSEYPLGTLSFD